MKKIIFCFFISSQVFASTVWTLGTTSISLEKVSDDGFVSKSCVKDCALKKKVKENLSKLKDLEPRGGQDPASLFCKSIEGQVVYMSQDENQETFCTLGDDIISLSLLLP